VKPVNRNLLIEKCEQVEDRKAESSAFLLPEDYKSKAIERYSIVRILKRADDCEKIRDILRHDKCVVETSMINEVKVGGKVYNIVGENYVVLVLGDE
tara:strand:- start:364 stop:654 length:291 start_codon:yes stop_codon:yes gene_type:complete